MNLTRFDSAGGRIVTVGQKVVKLFEASTGQLITDIVHRVPQVTLDVDFAADGRLVTATEHGNVRLWNTRGLPISPPMQQQFGDRARQSKLHTVRFSPDGRLVVAASEDGVAGVWDTGSRTLVHLLVHSNRVNSARFSPDGNWIVTASWDETARVWNARTGVLALPVLQHEREVDWADFDPTGRRVATASKDKLVRLWSAKTGQLLVPPLRHADLLPERDPFDFSPDGTLLATIAGAELQIWGTETGQPITPSIKLGARLNSVRFSRDGTRVVTACHDGSARIWDALTGHQLSEPLRHAAPVTYAEFSPDGSRVLTSSTDGTARIWPVIAAPVPVPEWLPELAEAVAGERMDEQNLSQPLSVGALYQLRQKLTPTHGTNYYERWAAWFFDDSAGRERWPE